MTGRLVALLTLLGSSAALAQDTPNGIKIGDGRLHPYFDLEARFDSAVGYFAPPPPAAPTLGLQPDIIFRFRPGVKFEVLNTDTVVNFNGNAEYVLNSGLLTPSARDASRFQTDIGLDAAFNKTGAVEFQIGDQLLRSDRTNNNPLLSVATISLFNTARLAVPIHPGGGALEFTPKATWAVEFFEPLLSGLPPGCVAGDRTCDPNQVREMNYNNLNFGLGARWKFLPKTAVVFDGGVDLRSYFNVLGAPATLMKLQLGLAGLISTKFSLLLLGGYGRNFAVANGASTFIGQAEVGILVSELITFKLGYVRTLQPVPVFGIFGDDRGYAEAKVASGRFSVVASAAFDYLSYYVNAPVTGTLVARADQAVSLAVTPQVKILSWFSVAAGYNLTMRISSVATAKYDRHEAILALKFSY